MQSSDFDTAVVRTSDERSELAAYAWGLDYANRHGSTAHIVAPADVTSFVDRHHAAVIVVGVRSDLASEVDSDAIVRYARETGRPVVVVPSSGTLPGS